MFKIVSIRDVGAKVEIIGRGVIRTPINKILLTDEQIYRLLNTHMGPKQVFLINPANENQSVRLTLANCTTPVEEIFGAPKAEVAVEPETTETYTLDDVAEPETADETVAEVAEDPQTDVEVADTDVVATEPEAPVVEEEEAAPADAFVTGTVVGDVDETVVEETVTTVAETAEDTEPAQKPTYYKNNYKKNNYKKN